MHCDIKPTTEIAEEIFIYSIIEYPYYLIARKPIAEQVFPKNFVPILIFMIGGVILINNSMNLKLEKNNFNSRLIKMVSVKNSKQGFS